MSIAARTDDRWSADSYSADPHPAPHPCRSCSGLGHHIRGYLAGGRNATWIEKRVPCPDCGGTGGEGPKLASFADIPPAAKTKKIRRKPGTRPFLPDVTIEAMRRPSSWAAWELTPVDTLILTMGLRIYGEMGIAHPDSIASELHRNKYDVRDRVKQMRNRGVWVLPDGTEGDPVPSGDLYLDDVEMPEPSEGEKQRIREEIIKIRYRKRAEHAKTEPPIGHLVSYSRRTYADPRKTFSNLGVVSWRESGPRGG
jgi:DnaJ-class molecular chaperone